MSSITIRNVPPELRVALKAKAKSSGRSLQKVALEALVDKAERKDPDEWLRDARATARKFGSTLGSHEIVRPSTRSAVTLTLDSSAAYEVLAEKT